MKYTRHFLTATLLAGLCSGAFAQASYDTEAVWTPSDGYVGPLGFFGETSMGQTFNAPTGGYDTLLDYSFWIRGFTNTDGSPATDVFSAQVYRWDPVAMQPMGGALFTQNLGTQSYGFSPTQVTIDPNLHMTVGDKYVALLTDNTATSTFELQQLPSPQAGDGGGSEAYLNGVVWFSGLGNDLAWHADFSKPSATPEPFTIGLGIAGIGVALRRRVRTKGAK